MDRRCCAVPPGPLGARHRGGRPTPPGRAPGRGAGQRAGRGGHHRDRGRGLVPRPPVRPAPGGLTGPGRRSNGQLMAGMPDDERLRRLRLAAQRLTPATAAAGVAAAARAVVGVQAQHVRAAGLALRSRVPGLRRADVDGSGLVRTWTVRGTVHLVRDRQEHVAHGGRRLVPVPRRFRGATRRAGQRREVPRPRLTPATGRSPAGRAGKGQTAPDTGSTGWVLHPRDLRSSWPAERASPGPDEPGFRA
jgi:Winged helix DNA-binding domain